MKFRALLAITVTVITICCLMASLFMGCRKKSPDPDAGKMKVGFVYSGPIGDAGWTLAQDRGREYLEKHLDYVKTSYVENIPENSTAEKAIYDMAMEGNSIVFTASYLFLEPTLKVAQKFPRVIFMHCSGDKIAPNVSTYFGRIYQARYLTGLVAGKMTKTKILGYVAAFPIPEVVRGINAFSLGARKANPGVTVRVLWTNTWFDPPTERLVAEKLLNGGADVIAQHQNTFAPQQAAQEKGAYSIGYHQDMAKYAPKAQLTAAVWNWGPYYVKVVESVKQGTWKSEQYWGGMNEGVVDIAPFGPMVPEKVRKMVLAEKQRIIDGSNAIFVGPLRDNKGALRVEKRHKMSDEELLKFDWFVEGVEGTL